MDRKSVMAWLEGLAQDDWRMFHSDSEVQEIARNALAMLKEQPEIVRCKDCKHWDYRTEGCMHLTGRIAPIVKTGADWYCCDGERKDT